MKLELSDRAIRRIAQELDTPKSIIVFHGTTKDNAQKIKQYGLQASESMGYESARWFMVSEDFESAAYHAGNYTSEKDEQVVLEFEIPTETKTNGRFMWDGYPYLWPPQDMEWDASTRWWALRQPIPPEFIKEIYDLSDSEET